MVRQWHEHECLGKIKTNVKLKFQIATKSIILEGEIVVIQVNVLEVLLIC